MLGKICSTGEFMKITILRKKLLQYMREDTYHTDTYVDINSHELIIRQSDERNKKRQYGQFKI